MSDAQQDISEALDEDAEPMVESDRVFGAQAYGAAGTEPPIGESVRSRAAREEPEERPGDAASRGEPDRPGPVTDDFALERAATPPAEEAAMSVEPMAGFDPLDDPPVTEADLIDSRHDGAFAGSVGGAGDGDPDNAGAERSDEDEPIADPGGDSDPDPARDI